MAAVRFGVAQRRARLAVRHRLAPAARGAGVVEVVRDMLALHATDPSTVYLSAWARLRSPTVAELDRALYDDRVLVRILGMRRTMFVVPVELVPVVQAACTRAIAAVERRRTVQFLAEGGLADDVPTWLAEVEEATVAALKVRGSALSTELSEDEPRLSGRIVVARRQVVPGGRRASRRGCCRCSPPTAGWCAVGRGDRGPPAGSTGGRRSRRGCRRASRRSTPSRPGSSWPAAGCVPSDRRRWRT